jgi:FtsZ-interacting cell division protein ZipA
MNQNTTVWIVIIAVAAVALVFFWLYTRRQRSAALRQRFGEEYRREVERSGSVSRAEQVLDSRARRVERLHIRPLSADLARRFADQWRGIQTRFVDQPDDAVREADRLVGEVMHERGYPVTDFEQQVADISVDHPDVVMNYRAARDIAERRANGHVTTEDLRQAMVHYRALFRDLLGQPTSDVPAAADAEATRRI